MYNVFGMQESKEFETNFDDANTANEMTQRTDTDATMTGLANIQCNNNSTAASNRNALEMHDVYENDVIKRNTRINQKLNKLTRPTLTLKAKTLNVNFNMDVDTVAQIKRDPHYAVKYDK